MWIFLIAALRQAKYRRRLFGSLRLFAFVSCVAIVLTALSVRRARAAFREQAWSLGDELKPVADLVEGTTRLRLNGQSVFVSMTTVHDSSVSQVLDRFEAVCQKNPGPFARKMLAVSRIVPERLPGAALLREALSELALSRDQTSERGAILCLTQNGVPRDDDALEQFMATSDLGALGDLKYVTVTRGSAKKERNSARVVTLWTEGHFVLDALAPPEHGDAPGSDSKLAPRPPGSVRTFSAEAVDAPYGVRLYETAESPAAVLAFYEHTLHDFEVVPLPKAQAQAGRAFLKQGIPLLVMVAAGESRTTVTLSEVGANSEPVEDKR